MDALVTINLFTMRPLILDYTTDRGGEYEPVYEYNDILSLNTVATKNGNIPFMDLTSSELSLVTKTRVMGEQDDDNISSLQLITKTKVLQESDDDEMIHFLQLQTKTFVKQESDD